jgi:hypothetical protein
MTKQHHILTSAPFAFGTVAAFFLGYLLLSPFAHAASITLALNHIVRLGKYQTLLGDFFTAVGLSLVLVPLLVIAKGTRAWVYAAIGAVGTLLIEMILAPFWPSNNDVLFMGLVLFVVTIVLCASLAARALTLRSSGTAQKRAAP